MIAGYLVWLRSKYQTPVSPKSEIETQEIVTTPSPTASALATPATSSAKEATGSMKEKTSTSSSGKK